MKLSGLYEKIIAWQCCSFYLSNDYINHWRYSSGCPLKERILVFTFSLTNPGIHLYDKIGPSFQGPKGQLRINYFSPNLSSIFFSNKRQIFVFLSLKVKTALSLSSCLSSLFYIPPLVQIRNFILINNDRKISYFCFTNKDGNGRLIMLPPKFYF